MTLIERLEAAKIIDKLWETIPLDVFDDHTVWLIAFSVTGLLDGLQRLRDLEARIEQLEAALKAGSEVKG